MKKWRLAIAAMAIAAEMEKCIGNQKAEIAGLLKESQAALYPQAKARLNGPVKSGDRYWQGVEEFFSTGDDSFKDWLKESWSKPSDTGVRSSGPTRSG